MKFAHKLTLALLVVLAVVLSLCNTVLIGQNILRLAAGTQRSTQRRRSQNFTPIRAFHALISFLRQYRIILRADTASEVRQLLSQKRR